MDQLSTPSRPQPIDATTVRALVAELRPVLVPSRFEKAQQPDGQTLQLALRHLDGVQWLELSWLAEAPRLLAIPPPPRAGEGSTLASQVLHGLRGLALVAMEQQGWERVVRLAFAQRPGDPIQRHLVLELMGRHSNLFLLNAQLQVVALARQVRPEQSRWRPIGTGDPYVPPPPLRGECPRSEEPRDHWRRRLLTLPQPLGTALLDVYQGVSPALVRQLLEPIPADGAMPRADQPVDTVTAEQWDQLWDRWQAWLTAVERERFSPWWDSQGTCRCWGGAGDGGPPTRLPLHGALAQATHAWLRGRDLERRRHALQSRLEAWREREGRQAAEQEALLEAAAGSEDLQRQADALLCLAAPGKERILEAQTLYKRARKLRRSVAAITPRLEAHRQRQVWLEEALVYAEQADQPDQLAGLEEDLRQWEPKTRSAPQASPRPQPKREGPAAALQPLELRSPSGLSLLVGRNHRQNDWISLRQARRGDVWFHAQEMPGSHVVLKASEGLADPLDFAAAADVAAHFSRGRGNSRVPVVMVPVEGLQRLPGAAAGTVRHRGGEILWGHPDRARPLLEAA
jgi:predicted ribosome quality control (RQC) complex YloA/Tae2 family protein